MNVTDEIFKKGIELKIFISIFSSSRYWFSDRFVMHTCKFCNKNNFHSILSFEQTADLILKYLTSKQRNLLDNIQFYQLVTAVQLIMTDMEKEVNKSIK